MTEPLTREQFVELVEMICDEAIMQDHPTQPQGLLDHDATLRARLEAVTTEVKEWLCDTCNTVYPGPPQQGFSCVICPKCDGECGPRGMIERRRLEQQLAAVTQERDEWKESTSYMEYLIKEAAERLDWPTRDITLSKLIEIFDQRVSDLTEKQELLIETVSALRAAQRELSEVKLDRNLMVVQKKTIMELEQSLAAAQEEVGRLRNSLWSQFADIIQDSMRPGSVWAMREDIMDYCRKQAQQGGEK